MTNCPRRSSCCIPFHCFAFSLFIIIPWQLLSISKSIEQKTKKEERHDTKHISEWKFCISSSGGKWETDREPDQEANEWMNERASERAEHNNNIRVTCRWIFGVQFSLALLVAGNAALGIGCSDASRSLLSFSYRFVVRLSSGHG